MPVSVLLHQDERRPGLQLAGFIAFVKLQASIAERDGNVRAYKANITQRVTELATLIHGVKNMPMRCFNSATSIELTSIDVNEGYILREDVRVGLAVRCIPGDLDLLQGVINSLLVSRHGSSSG